MSRYALLLIYLLICGCQKQEQSHAQDTLWLSQAARDPVQHQQHIGNQKNDIELLVLNDPLRPYTEHNWQPLLPAGQPIPKNMVFVEGEKIPDEEQEKGMKFISGFFLDSTEVAPESFALFTGATGYRSHAETLGGGWIWDRSGKEWQFVAGKSWQNGHPQKAVFLNWYDAAAYCNWQRKRLPFKHEWEMARKQGKISTNAHPFWLADWVVPPNWPTPTFIPDGNSRKWLAMPEGFGLSPNSAEPVKAAEFSGCRCVAER